MKNKMKILWFANNPCGATSKLRPNTFTGGWLSSLERELKQQENIELHVCFYWHKSLLPFEYNTVRYYPIKREGDSSKIARLLHRVLNKNSDKAEIAQLVDTVDLVQPDIIHIHGSERNFGLIQKYVNIPTLISIQGILSPCCEKFFSGIPKSVASKYERFSAKLARVSSSFSFRNLQQNATRERMILQEAKYVMGRTDWDRRVTRVLAPHSKYFVGNEILRPVFYTKKWSKQSFDDTLKLVTTTTPTLYKGIETIVKTAKILSEHTDINFQWTIIGVSETDAVAQTIRKWLKVNYKSLNIRFVGKKEELKLVDILLDSDIYCQVSRIENSPNSVSEAMLLGMPVIASFAGGTSSLLEDKKEGLLVQEGEPYSYAGAIVEMSSLTKQQIFAYTTSARERAQTRHSKQNILNEVVGAYSTMLKTL